VEGQVHPFLIDRHDDGDGCFQFECDSGFYPDGQPVHDPWPAATVFRTPDARSVSGHLSPRERSAPSRSWTRTKTP